MSTFGSFGPLFATNYIRRMDAAIFEAKMRNYPSVLEMELERTRLPLSVYDSLISSVRANLPLVQRYLRLRQRLLGLDKLHMYDLYVPLVDEVESNVSFADAKKEVLAALALLGARYVARLKRLFDDRRIDVMPNKGKETGAFSMGVWGLPPYVLLNWSGKFQDTSTLAHEAGHNRHSEEANDQEYVDSGYTIFCAEVASTVNEQLLSHYRLSRTINKNERLFLLNSQLEAIRLTIVRQTLFAEFEREAFRLAEAGQTVTLDVLNALGKQLNEEYYGPAAFIDDLVKHEWSRIPHHMNPFYVFTYATSTNLMNAWWDPQNNSNHSGSTPLRWSQFSILVLMRASSPTPEPWYMTRS